MQRSHRLASHPRTSVSSGARHDRGLVDLVGGSDPEVPPPHRPMPPNEPPTPLRPDPGGPPPIIPDPLPERPEPGAGDGSTSRTTAGMTLAGTTLLDVTISPASAVDLSGDEARPTYTGPDPVTPDVAFAVTESALAEDFEGTMTWGVGVDEQGPFRVEALEDPLRVVVDVRAG